VWEGALLCQKRRFLVTHGQSRRVLWLFRRCYLLSGQKSFTDCTVLESVSSGRPFWYSFLHIQTLGQNHSYGLSIHVQFL